MRSIRRLTLVSLAAAVIVSGCEGGSSDEPQPITFTPAAAPPGTGFVAMYAPPVDNVPYPNDIYNPTGTKLAVPVKVTSPLASALNTLDGFSTTAVLTMSSSSLRTDDRTGRNWHLSAWLRRLPGLLRAVSLSPSG